MCKAVDVQTGIDFFGLVFVQFLKIRFTISAAWFEKNAVLFMYCSYLLLM